MVERQTENLKVRSSILLIGIITDLNHYLTLYQFLNKNNGLNYYSINSITKINNYSAYLLYVDSMSKRRRLYTELYRLYTVQYLQNIYNVKIKEKNINAINILPKRMTKFILYKTRNKSFKGFKIKYFNEVIYLFLVNIFLKNSKNICKFIKKKLEKVHFKEHRRYFLFFFRIINEYIKCNFKLLKIDGLLMKFKGKLSRGGNSRTKTMFFRVGKTSQGDKDLALNTNKWSVWTKTGSFSCMFQIFYK